MISQHHSSSSLVSSLSKRSYAGGFYGDKGPLGVYMNTKKKLTPVAELNIAKDYNTKINRSHKQNPNISSSQREKMIANNHTSFDASLTDALKNNLSLIHDLTINSPNYTKTDTLTLTSRDEPTYKPQLKRTVMSNVDNMRDLMNQQSDDLSTTREGLINYESSHKEWRPCVRKIDLKASETRENFDRPGLRAVAQPQNNPLLGEGNRATSPKLRINSPLSSYATNTESKRLIQYEYGAATAREEKPKMNTTPAYLENSPTQDFRKKKSVFQMDNTILRDVKKR